MHEDRDTTSIFQQINQSVCCTPINLGHHDLSPALEEIDPERILSDAVTAMKNSQTIHYSAVHEYLGIRAAVWAAIEGNVHFKKLPEETFFKTKIYQVSSLPTLYIIGADGNILYTGVGVESEGKENKPSEIMQAYYDKLVDIIEKQLKQIRH